MALVFAMMRFIYSFIEIFVVVVCFCPFLFYKGFLLLLSNIGKSDGMVKCLMCFYNKGDILWTFFKKKNV